MRDYFADLMGEREATRDRLPGLRRKASPTRMPRKVAQTLAANLLISTIAWWLESGRQYSPSQMAGWLLEIVANGYAQTLGL